LFILIMLYTLALALSVALVMNEKYTQLGVIGTLLVLTLAPVAFVLAATLHNRSDGRLIDRVDDLSRNVRMLADQSLLSDDARRVLNRQHERELLRVAIEEDIENRDWDAAMVLVKELAERFGYRADAEDFRRKIDQVRADTVDTDVTGAIGYLDGLVLQRRWDHAFAEAGRIQRLFPDSSRVLSLRSRVEQAQAAYKADLERRFLMAAQEGHADNALTLLKELDPYLTIVEGEPLRELARGVIGKARDNLGAQFKLAVQDRRWRQAASIGEQIIAEFPNSRMAAEVRDVIDGIRIRANEVAPAA